MSATYKTLLHLIPTITLLWRLLFEFGDDKINLCKVISCQNFVTEKSGLELNSYPVHNALFHCKQ